MQENTDRQLNRIRKQCMNKMRNLINRNHKRPNKNPGAKELNGRTEKFNKFNRLDHAKNIINQLEDRSLEVSHLGVLKSKRIKKSEENLHESWDTIKRMNNAVW